MSLRTHALRWLKKLVVMVVVELVTALIHTAFAAIL